jgi:hypothetical protein
MFSTPLPVACALVSAKCLRHDGIADLHDLRAEANYLPLKN